MKIRRELIDALFVIVLVALLHSGFEEYGKNLDYQYWSIICAGIALTLAGYAVFRYMLFAENRDREWRGRVGTPATMRLDLEGGRYYDMLCTLLESLKHGSQVQIIAYYG